MAGVLDLRDVLELVIDGLDNGPFAQQELVAQAQQAIFHVAAQMGDQLDASSKEGFEQGLGEVAFVGKEFAKQGAGQVGQRRAVIDIAGAEMKSQQLALVVDHLSDE